LSSGIITSVSSAIVGLIGAAIGAIADVAGVFISQQMQARAAQERALHSKKEEAYSSTLRYLLRAQNRRSKISGRRNVRNGTNERRRQGAI
jgi:Arc/MetJ family transcription regulator